MAKEVGDCGGEGGAYASLGNAYGSLGQYQMQVDFMSNFCKLLRKWEIVGPRVQPIATLEMLINHLGNTKRLLAFVSNHLEISKEVGDCGGEGRAYCNFGNDYYSIGKYKMAIGAGLTNC